MRRNAFPEKPLARNGTCHFGTRPSLVGYRDPVMSQTPSTSIRTVALVGHGAAGKEEVGEMVRRLLRLAEVPKPADVADAAAIALYAVATRQSPEG